MRIIAGSAGGLRLKTLDGSNTRPTTDKVKEALFSKLQSLNMLDDARVLDLFAGSGALGLEAASRGAAEVDFVEKHAGAVNIVRENIAAVEPQVQAQLKAYQQSAKTFLATASGSYELIFMDPPYGQIKPEEYLELAVPLLEKHSLIVFEKSVRDPDLILPESLRAFEQKTYGETEIVLLELAA